MNLSRFEMGKLWRQKKFFLLFAIVLLFIGGIFYQNYSKQEMKGERALEEIKKYVNETDKLYTELSELNREGTLDEMQEKQYEYTNEMSSAFFQWKNVIYKKEWSKIPTYEKHFLTNLLLFEKVGGQFGSLQGIEKEKMLQKNDWLQAHDLSYEDENFPISPALILKESAGVLLGFIGILILLLFFGNTITVEKEQQTWSTLRTQPIAKWKLIMAKYSTLLMTLLIFITIVVSLGLIIPMIFSGYSMNLKYPLILTSGDNFEFISTAQYLTRGIVLFLCASTFAFSLIFLISTWIKNSFSALMVTGFILLIGFLVTDLNASIGSAINPFQYFQFSQLLSEIPQSTDWLYPLAAFIWSTFLVLLAGTLPEKEITLLRLTENQKPFKDGETKNELRKVWNMTIFEWRKVQRKGLLKQVYIVLSFVIVIGYFVIAERTHQKEVAYMDELNERSYLLENFDIPLFEELLASSQNAKKDTDEGIVGGISQDPELFEKIIVFYHETIEKNKTAISSYKKQEWLPFYDYQNHEINFLQSINDIYESVGEYNGGEFSHISKFTKDVSIAEKSWLKEKSIQPLLSGEYVPTIHNNWEDSRVPKKDWEEENSKIDNSGLFSLYLYFDKYFYFIPLVLFLFLLGAGFSNEKGKSATLQLLRTQPIAEKKVFLGKGIQSTVTAVLSSIGLFTFVILVATVLNRFGDWDYPILRYDSKRLMDTSAYAGIRTPEGGGHFIPLGDYLLQSVLLFLCVLLFIIGLSIFISLFLQSQFAVFATAIIIGIAGYVGSIQVISDKAHLSPFTYMNIQKITNGEISALVNNPGINMQMGSLVLLASTLLLFLIGYFLLWVKNRVKYS